MENEESSQQYDILLRQKTRLEEDRNEAVKGMETMTRNIEILTKTKVHNERQIKKLIDEKKEGEEGLQEVTDDLEKKVKIIEDIEDEQKTERKAFQDLDYTVIKFFYLIQSEKVSLKYVFSWLLYQSGIGKTGLDRIEIIGSDWIVSFFSDPIQYD